MKPNRILSALLSSAATLAVAAAEAALVSHWKLDDGPPSAVASDSAGANPAAFAAGSNSPAWSTSPALGPYALAFNGNQWASAPDSSSLDVSSGITLSAWVKRARTNTREIFLGKGAATHWTTTSFWLEFQANNRAAFYVGSATADHLLIGTATITDTDNWHHLLGTWDGTVQRLYVDGALQAGTLSWSGTITNSSNPFTLGRVDYGSLWFSGLIDDVGLWNTALNEGEAIALHNLALHPAFQFDLGRANQVFAVYETQSAPIYLGGYRWEYRTGLTGALGVPTPDGMGNYLLKLDGGAGPGAGLIAAVPEPSGLTLIGIGSVFGSLWLWGWRRRRE